LEKIRERDALISGAGTAPIKITPGKYVQTGAIFTLIDGLLMFKRL